MSRSAPGCKVYIGNLDITAVESDLDQAFAEAGKIVKIWIAKKPPGFAFVEYDDARDAKAAVEKLNGTTVRGKTIRVELSNRSERSGGRPREQRERDRDVRDSYNRYDRPRRSRSRSPTRRRGSSPRRLSRSRSRSPTRRRGSSPRRLSRSDNHNNHNRRDGRDREDRVTIPSSIEPTKTLE